MAPPKEKQPTDSTPAETESETTAASEKKVVEFTGFSGTLRSISKDDLLRVGIEEKDLENFETLSWTPENGHKVDVSSVPQSIVDVLVRQPEMRLAASGNEA